MMEPSWYCGYETLFMPNSYEHENIATLCKPQQVANEYVLPGHMLLIG